MVNDIRALLMAVLVFVPVLGQDAPYTVAPELFDMSRAHDLGLKFTPDTKSFTVYAAGESDDRYVNGVVLIGFKGKLYAQWQTSRKDEDSPDTHTVYAVSRDGAHWSTPMALPRAGKHMTTSGGWWTDGKILVAYLNGWEADYHDGGATEYVTSRDGIHWSKPQRLTDAAAMPIDGVIEQDPHALPDGRIVTAFHLKPGLRAAPFYTDDPKGLTGWTRGAMPNLAHSGRESRELEPSWFRQADGCLVMVFRDQADTFKQLASKSCDRGATWSQPSVTTMPDSRMKQSAGNFPDGSAYIVHAPSGVKLRSPLVLTTSKDGRHFDHAFILAAGPPPAVRSEGLYKRPGYHYPKSVVWNDTLWVGYASGKEDVVVTRVPLADLH